MEIKTRMCIACKTRKNKSELYRIVKDDDGPTLDKAQKMQTRGIYLCKNKKCIDKLKSMKDISKCVKISITKEKIIELLNVLEEM